MYVSDTILRDLQTLYFSQQPYEASTINIITFTDEKTQAERDRNSCMITQLKITVKSRTEGGGHLQAIPQAYPVPCSPFEKAASFITNYISLQSPPRQGVQEAEGMDTRGHV